MDAKQYLRFCGASEGVNPAYAEQARQLGQLLAAQGRRLIYGGGKKGLMGIVADAVLAAGGEAVGIIPERPLKRKPRIAA